MELRLLYNSSTVIGAGGGEGGAFKYYLPHIKFLLTAPNFEENQDFLAKKKKNPH
jgi:hypothetical protein